MRVQTNSLIVKLTEYSHPAVDPVALRLVCLELYLQDIVG